MLLSTYILEAIRLIKNNSGFFNPQEIPHEYETRYKSNLYLPKTKFTKIDKKIYSSIIQITPIRKYYLKGEAFFNVNELFNSSIL